MLLWLNSPSVKGCTDSLALVKRAMSFRGPPLERCCRWYFFSSDSGIKRFSILWYCTSTWERRKHQPSCFSVSNCTYESLNWLTMLHLGLSGLLLGSKWTSFLSNWVWSTYASFTIWGGKKGEIELDISPVCTSVEIDKRVLGLLSWLLLHPVPCSCCGKRKPTALLSSLSWSCAPGDDR